MHLGVTGTRKGMNETQFNILKEFLLEDCVTKYLHQGDCIGVDNQFTLMVKDILPQVKIVEHPPIKKRNRAFGPYDITNTPKEYLERDKDIVNESDYLYAVPNSEEIIRSGTWTTVRYARGKIPITIVMPSGKIIYE